MQRIVLDSFFSLAVIAFVTCCKKVAFSDIQHPFMGYSYTLRHLFAHLPSRLILDASKVP